jgi:membrane-associated HD superfamily phosphohydrolase
MRYIRDISKQNFLRIFKDKKIRFYYIFVLVLILLSAGILAYRITDKTYSYNVGDIAQSDIRVQRDIYFVKESETDIEKKRALQAEKLVFDKNSSVLQENLKIADDLFGAIIKTLEDYPPLSNNDLSIQLEVLKNRLPGTVNYSDKILLSLLSHDNPRQLKNAVLKMLIYIYDYRGLGVLEKEYNNPLNLEIRTITVRNEDSAELNDEISAVIEDLVTIDNVKGRIYSICYSVAPYLPQDTILAVAAIIKSNLKPNLSFNEEETKRRIDEKLKGIKPVTGVLKKGQTLVREGDTITNDVLQKITILNRHAQTSHVNFIIGVILLRSFLSLL